MSLLVQALISSHDFNPANAESLEQLSKREMEIVDSVAQGLTNREIAERLGLSQHTIKNYLFRVFDKVGVSSRVELLFMTFGRTNQPESTGNGLWKSDTDHGLPSDSILAECQRAAEEGASIAQLELARFYWNRRADSKDLIQAYKWYFIANRQISRTSKSVSKTMTGEQILQAEQLATEWLKKKQKHSPASIQDAPEHRPKIALRAASE
jgi:DNA-binding CsgD family transcriptional regulator